MEGGGGMEEGGMGGVVQQVKGNIMKRNLNKLYACGTDTNLLNFVSCEFVSWLLVISICKHTGDPSIHFQIIF